VLAEPGSVLGVAEILDPWIRAFGGVVAVELGVAEHHVVLDRVVRGIGVGKDAVVRRIVV
jgi:hypothetical protein